MRLKYLKGDKITVRWRDTSPPQSAEFLPEADVTDELGERLLANPKYHGWFKRVDVVQPEPFVCEVCGAACKSKLGLNSHKRKHKEQT